MFNSLEEAVEFAKLSSEKAGDSTKKYDVSGDLLIEMLNDGADIVKLNALQIGNVNYIQMVQYKGITFVSVTDEKIVEDQDSFSRTLLYPFFN